MDVDKEEGEAAAAMDVDKEGEAFEGASGGAMTAPLTHQCADCGCMYALYSWVCYCKGDGAKKTYELVDGKDSKLTRALNGGNFENLTEGLGGEVRLVCALCFCTGTGVPVPGKSLKSPTGPVTSAWQKVARATKDRVMPSRKAEWLLKRHEIAATERGEDVAAATNAKHVYGMLLSNESARSGTDWVVQLGEHVVLLYGCWEPSCQYYPLRSNNWWRLIKSTVAIEEGLTKSGESTGQWACPLCLAPWSWGAGGDTRLMVFGDSSDDLRRDDRYAYIGECTAQQSNLINFLKGAKMLRTIGGDL
jgi:hypothetical protein